MRARALARLSQLATMQHLVLRTSGARTRRFLPRPLALRPIHRPILLQLHGHNILRPYNTTPPLSDYPKEGVFQRNSPQQHPLTRAAQHQPPSQSPNSLWQQPPYTHNTEPLFYRRYLPTIQYLIYLAFWVVSFNFGTRRIQAVANTVQLPLEPGSLEDAGYLQQLTAEYENLPLVQQLREEIAVDQVTGARAPAWREWAAYRALWDPTSTIASIERRKNTLTTGPCAGSAGLAAQSIFYNERTQTLILFVNFGAGTCGWPGVVHGGAIATVLDEGLGRVALRSTVERAAVTANLEIEYKEKVLPGQWYVLYAQLVGEETWATMEKGKDGNMHVRYEHADVPRIMEAGSDVLEAVGRRMAEGQQIGVGTAGGGSAMSAPSPASQGSQGSQANISTIADTANSTNTPTEETQPQSQPPRKPPSRKRYVQGFLGCAGFDGPTFDDSSTPGQRQFQMHTHAVVKGLFVVPKDMELPSAGVKVQAIADEY